MAPLGSISTILKGITVISELNARDISRDICLESFEYDENIRTNILLLVIASSMDAAQSCPGRISLGVIQHLILLVSSEAQTASATNLSFEEYEINTSCAIVYSSFKTFIKIF